MTAIQNSTMALIVEEIAGNLTEPLRVTTANVSDVSNDTGKYIRVIEYIAESWLNTMAVVAFIVILIHYYCYT